MVESKPICGRAKRDIFIEMVSAWLRSIYFEIVSIDLHLESSANWLPHWERESIVG